MKHNVHPALESLLIPIEKLNLDPKNARQHGKRNLKDIKISYEAHGQLKPIVVQEKGMVVRAGNGQLMAVKELGWTHIAAVVFDESNEEAMAFAIRDNRTSETSEWDLDNLGGVLTDLQDYMDLNTLGFADYELEPIMTSAEDWKPPEVNPDGTFVIPEKKTNVAFTKEEFAELETLLSNPGTAANILNVLRSL